MRRSWTQSIVLLGACLLPALLLWMTGCGGGKTAAPSTSHYEAKMVEPSPHQKQNQILSLPSVPGTEGQADGLSFEMKENQRGAAQAAAPKGGKAPTAIHHFDRRPASGGSGPTDGGSAAPLTANPATSQDAQIERDLSNLKNNGNLAYFTPKTMSTGSSAIVTARIGFGNLSASALTNRITENQTGDTTIKPTPVTTRMKMTLTSADFDIQNWSSEEQAVGGSEPTEWQWQITPKHSGTLHLHLAAIIEVDNLSRDFTTVNRDITVRVGLISAFESFLEAHIEWILGSLFSAFTALAAWWWNRRKKTMRRKKTPKVAVR